MKQSNVLQEFVELYNKVEDLSSNFSRERLTEYSELCARLNKCAVTIFREKMCPYTLVGNNEFLVFHIEGKDYKIIFDDIISLLDTSEIIRLQEEKHQREKEEKAKTATTNYQEQQNPFEAMVRMFMAPFANGNGFMPPATPPQRETSLLEDISAIQKKVILLEEKNKELAASDEAEKLKEEISALKEQIETLNKEKAEAEELWSTASEENETLKRGAEEAKVNLEVFKENEKSLKASIENLKEQIKELEESASDSEETSDEEVNALKDELASLRTSLFAANNRIKELESLPKPETIPSEEIEDLKSQLEEYKKLAYVDHKYGVMNANAYHNFIESCEKDEITVCICGISNTKQINQLYGRNRGDNVISLVAKRLAAMFGQENVYRIYGDQFVSFVKNANSSKIKREFSSLQNELFMDKVSISFGVVDAVTCETIQLAIKQAEGDMNSMKVKSGHKAILSKDYNNIHAEEAEEEPKEEIETAEDDKSDEVERFSEEDVDVLSKTMVQNLNEEIVDDEAPENDSNEDDDDTDLFDLV